MSRFATKPSLLWLTHWLAHLIACPPRATAQCDTTWYLLWHAAIQTFWSVFNIQYFNIKPSPDDTLRYFHRYLGQLSAIMLPSDHFPYFPFLMNGGKAGRWRLRSEEDGSSARVKYKIIVTSSARDSCVTGGRGTPGYLWRFLWKFMVFLMGHFFLLWDYDTVSLFAGLIPLSQAGSERVQCVGCTT